MVRHLLLMAIALMVCCTGTLPAAEHTKDKPAEVKKAVDDGKAVIIDVREEDEWKEGHLDAAQLLPLSVLKEGVSDDKLKEIFGKGKIVYLHCKAGGRCLKAADLLKDKGYDIRALKLGYTDLVKEGFPSKK